MKRCPYCGAEHPDDAVMCRIDKTPFPDSSNDIKVGEAGHLRRLERLRYVLRYTVLIVIVALLYLLSFGPVSRYGGDVVYQNFTPTTNIINGHQIIRRSLVEIRYPRWVSVFYYPAFQMTSGGRSGIYADYISWWRSRAKTPNAAPTPTAP